MSSSDKGPGSDAPLPSHPLRDNDADADISRERKRPRISDDEESPSKGSHDSESAVISLDSPPIELIIDESPQPSSQGSCLIMEDTLPVLLSTFPITDKDKWPTPENAAKCLADDIDRRMDLDDEEMLSLADWLSNAAAVIEDDSRHFEYNNFWWDVARIIDALLHREFLGSEFPHQKMGPILTTLCQGMARLSASFLRYEAANIDRCVSRRDSVRLENGDGFPPYTPSLAPCIAALNTVLKPKCELYAALVKKNHLQRFVIPPVAGEVFIEASQELADLVDLFEKYVANMTALEDPYRHILNLVELSSLLLDSSSKHPRWKLPLLAVERISHIFDEAYFTLFPKMMSIQSREIPGLHNHAVDMFQALVHCLCRDHEGFTGNLFTKLALQALQTTSQSHDTTDDEITQTFERCKRFAVSCTSYLFKLDMSLRLVRSGIRDHRITGITLSNSTLVAALSEVKARKDKPNIGQDPLCQTLALYCLRLDLIGAIFGLDSHADVISQASESVIFLLVTDHFTTADIDKIWIKLSSSSQPDMTQACVHILNVLTSDYLTLEHISYLLTRLTELQALPNAIYCSWIDELAKRAQHLSRDEAQVPMQVEIATKLVNLLSHNLSLCIVVNIEIVVNSLLIFLGTVLDGVDEVSTTHLIEYCVQRIGTGTQAATGHVHALNALLSKGPASVSKCKDASLLNSVLSDFKSYKSSKPDQELDSISSHELFPRVQLLLFVLRDMDEADAVLFEETVWNLVVGPDAIGHAGRAIGVNAIVTWYDQHQGLTGFGQRCVEDFLPRLLPEDATPGLSHFHRLLRRADRSPSSALLNSTLLEQLIRLALSSSSAQLAVTFEDEVCSWLFGSVAQDHPDEARQAQVAVSQQCLRALATVSKATQMRALCLLKRLVADGSVFERTTTTACSIVNLGVLKVGISDLPEQQSGLKVNVEALRSPEPPMRFSLLVALSASLSEVQAAILKHTGFSRLRALAKGQHFDFDTQPSSTIAESGLTHDTALLVQRVWSVDDIYTCPTLSRPQSAIEETLLRHHAEIYALLGHETTSGVDSTKADASAPRMVSGQEAPPSDSIAKTIDQSLSEQACMLLKHLPVPVSFKVSIAKQTLPESFSAEHCWKTEYSVYVLQVVLAQQISQGFADGTFITQSIRVLVDVLAQNSAGTPIHPLKTTVTALLSFLRGKTHNQEQPAQDASSDYFDNPQQFIRSTMQILSQLASEEIEATDWIHHGVVRVEFAEKTFQCILEAMVSCSSIRVALLGDDGFKQQFKLLLGSKNQAIAFVVAQSLMTLCEATALTSELAALFWSVVEDMLVENVGNELLARPLHHVAPSLLCCHKQLLSDENSVRSLIERMVELLWQIRPEEAFNSSDFDHRIRVLFVLLRQCVVQLKSLKQPLNLGQLAVGLFERFLFPEISIENQAANAIKNMQSRQIAYGLVGLLCDDRATHARLIEAMRNVHSWADDALSNVWTYPGRESYLREEQSHIGLVNLGQTCYLNSLLQQLFMNFEFRKFILEINIPDKEKWPVVVQFQELFSALHFSSCSNYTPSALAEILGIDVTMQEDAHLFFTMLISRLEDSMPDKESKAKLQSFFGGRNRSQTKGECGHVSESTDDYLNLSLTVKDKRNLTESLQEYVAGASLEGGDKFKCTTCEEQGKQAYVNAMRRTGLETIPNNLILGLKRFRYESMDGGTKVNDHFEFPPELDMAPFKLEYLSNPSKPVQPDKFELIGVIVHQGTLQFGHYWSYAKGHRTYGQQPGSWFRMEDASVRPVELDYVLGECTGGDVKMNNGEYRERSDSAYILIYRRMSFSPAAGEHATWDATPSIEVSQEQSKLIMDQNGFLEKTVHLFDVAHTQFVQQLLHQMDTFADVDSKHDGFALELALMHLHNVMAKTDTNGFREFQQMVERHALRSTENCGWLLCYVFDRNNNESFLFGRPQLRTATNQIVLASLKHLRQEDPNAYGLDQKGNLRAIEYGAEDNGLIWKILDSLSNLLPVIHRQRLSWQTFFGLIADIASIDVKETTAVLDLEIFEWCLRTFLTRWHSDNVLDEGVRTALRGKKTPWIVLPEMICRLLEDHVSLAPQTSDRRNSQGTHRIVNGRCMLNATEMSLIRTTTAAENGRSTLLRSLCAEYVLSEDSRKQIKGLAPYRLVQVLIEGDDFMVNMICDSIELFLLRVGGCLDGLICAAIAVCWSKVSMESKYFVVGAVTRAVTDLRLTEGALWFFEAILPTQLGATVWVNVDEWVSVLLRPSNDYTPEETVRWLCRNLLLRKVFTVPSTEDSLSVDGARIEAAMRLHRWAARASIMYMKHREPVIQIDSILRAYTALHLYLQRVFGIMIKGSTDRVGLMKNVLSDVDQLEFADDEPETHNPLFEHGGTIQLPPEIADLSGRCMHQVGQGRQLLMDINNYRAEEQPESDDEEDYEEDDFEHWENVMT